MLPRSKIVYIYTKFALNIDNTLAYLVKYTKTRGRTAGKNNCPVHLIGIEKKV